METGSAMINELNYHKIEKFYSGIRKNDKSDLNLFNLIGLSMSKKFLFITAFFLILSSLFLSYVVLAGDEIEIIGPEVHAGVGGKRYCGNNITSCGEPGKCIDLTGMVYCVRGRVVETRCLSNNIRNETLTTPCDGGSFEVNFVDVDGSDASVGITVYEKDSSDIIGKSSVTGRGYMNSLELSADMNVEFLNSEFVFLIKGADFTNFVGKTSNFVIGKVNAVVPGTTVFKAFYVELPSNFTFSAVVLKIK